MSHLSLSNKDHNESISKRVGISSISLDSGRIQLAIVLSFRRNWGQFRPVGQMKLGPD